MNEGSKKKNRVGKVLLIAGIALASCYVVGGTVAGVVVTGALFSSRGVPDKTDALYKRAEDYPILRSASQETFLSGENRLALHHYAIEAPKGTAIFAHGMNSSSHGPEVAVEAFLAEQGYEVYALDLTAHGDSEGSSMVGLGQSAKDVLACYRYLEEKGALKGTTLLSGYSMGGYGAARAAGEAKPDKLLTFSAYDCPYEMMVGSAASVAGPIAYATVPPFALGTLMARGGSEFERASDHIDPQTKVLAIQGKQDQQVSFSVSFAKKMQEKGADVFLGDFGHRTPWFSESSRKYVSEEILPVIKDYSKEQIKEFATLQVREKSSVMDAAMMDELSRFLSE